MNELKKQYDTILVRMHEIDDLCTKEKRSRSEAEETEWSNLKTGLDLIKRQIDMNGIKTVPDREGAKDAQIYGWVKRSLEEKKGETLALKRSFENLAAVAPLVPVTIGDIIQPLEQGLILDKVGVKMQTGLAGDYVYPVVASVTAEIADEGVSLTENTIGITKVTPALRRTGLWISQTNEALVNTLGLSEQIILQQLPMGVARLLNKCMFSTTAVDATLKGCFVAPGDTLTFAAAIPTYKELMNLISKVYTTGIEADGTEAFVMSTYMKYMLMATPIDEGSGVMICNNDRIAGIPVLTTEYIGQTHIGFGVFSYELLGQFGSINLTIDPYTLAHQSATRFIINGDYAMTSLRKEAFALGTVTA